MSQREVEWSGDHFAYLGDDLTAELGRVRSGGGTLVYEIAIYSKEKLIERCMRMNLKDAKKAANALLLNRS